MTSDPSDPKGVIAESYRIDGIGASECRSIFLDWALTPKGTGDERAHLEALLQRYGAEYPGHPMTAVLSESLAEVPPAKRRGGRAGRLG